MLFFISPYIIPKAGADTDHAKVVIITRSNCLIHIKLGNILRKSGKNSGKLSTKLGKIRTCA